MTISQEYWANQDDDIKKEPGGGPVSWGTLK